jgi:hypothetical protein
VLSGHLRPRSYAVGSIFSGIFIMILNIHDIIHRNASGDAGFATAFASLVNGAMVASYGNTFNNGTAEANITPMTVNETVAVFVAVLTVWTFLNMINIEKVLFLIIRITIFLIF